MKKVFCFILLFCFYSVYSQSPEKFTYQSIVRSSNGAILQSADVGIRLSVLNDFETEMMDRTSIKVKESAAASKLLHSEAVLTESNEPRGRILKEI